MIESPSALEQPYVAPPQQQEAAKLGTWAFLATEALFFGALFLTYIIYRNAYPRAFAEASRHTLVDYGTLNTALLLTSSLTMALAVESARRGARGPLIRLLWFTIGLGCSFLAVKGVEYHQDLREHLWPGHAFASGLPREAQLFWLLYWMMTGVHAAHVTAGVVLLSLLAWKASRGRFSGDYYTPVEMTGLYWHFVDVIWIFLYPLLYLIHTP